MFYLYYFNMIIHNSDGNFIDLNSVNPNTEIHIGKIFGLSRSKEMDVDYDPKTLTNKFELEEVEVNDASSSIYYTQYGTKILACIYGPRETRFRDKAKSDEAIVEVYSKYFYEINKESRFY
jgi:hypothetical protein